MNKQLIKLTNEMYNTDISFFIKKIGNDKIIRDSENINHYYFNNIICKVNLNNKTFILDYCGYTNYKLTTARINFLRNFYISKNYKLVCEFR